MDADDAAAAAGRERRGTTGAGEDGGRGARHPAEADLRRDAVGAGEHPVDVGTRVEAAEPVHVLRPVRRRLRLRLAGDGPRAVARGGAGGEQEEAHGEARAEDGAHAAAPRHC